MEPAGGVLVREYDPNKDPAVVEDLDKRCQIGSFFISQMGDAVARVRRFPTFHMLVAEIDDDRRELVGVIRGGIKSIRLGIQLPLETQSEYVKVGYVSGLRVLPSHRNKGIATKLVTKMEEWFKQNQAEYAYMITEHDNQASIKLFTTRCGYKMFRNFKFVINPVFAHRLRISPKINVIQVSQGDAFALYQHYFSKKEFFPEDIERLLSDQLSLGTFLAVPADTDSWQGPIQFISKPPDSWAMITSWNTRNVYRMAERNGSGFIRMVTKAMRILDHSMPFLGIPSFPDIFNLIGFLFLYGVAAEGPRGLDMIEAIRAHAHNVAMDNNCELVILELASCELALSNISGVKDFSGKLGMKRIGETDNAAWSKRLASPHSAAFFFDPRD